MAVSDDFAKFLQKKWPNMPIDAAGSDSKAAKEWEKAIQTLRTAYPAWVKLYKQGFGNTLPPEEALESAQDKSYELLVELGLESLLQSMDDESEKQGKKIVDTFRIIFAQFDKRISYFENMLASILQTTEPSDLVEYLDFLKDELKPHGIKLPQGIEMVWTSDIPECRENALEVLQSIKPVCNLIIPPKIEALKEWKNSLSNMIKVGYEYALHQMYILLFFTGKKLLKILGLDTMSSLIQSADPEFCADFNECFSSRWGKTDIKPLYQLLFEETKKCAKALQKFISSYNKCLPLLPNSCQILHVMVFIHNTSIESTYKICAKKLDSKESFESCAISSRNWKGSVGDNETTEIYRVTDLLFKDFQESVKPKEDKDPFIVDAELIETMTKHGRLYIDVGFLFRILWKHKRFINAFNDFVTSYMQSHLSQLATIRNLKNASQLSNQNSGDASTSTEDTKILSDHKKTMEYQRYLQDLESWRLTQSDKLLLWKARIQNSKKVDTIQQQVEKELDVGSLLNDSSDIKENSELKPFEINQLLYVRECLHRNYDKLKDLFAKEEVTFNDITILVQAISKELIKNFNLIDNDGSHFAAYLPNTKKEWPYEQMNENTKIFQVPRRMYSTLNSWNHGKESHRSGKLRIWTREACIRDFIKAGITPERIEKALQLSQSPTHRRVLCLG